MNRLECAKYIFSLYPNINGEQSLFKAGCNNYFDIVRFLIEEVNVNPSFDNNSCLAISVLRENYKIVDYLLQFDSVDPNNSFCFNDYDMNIQQYIVKRLKNYNYSCMLSSLLKTKKFNLTDNNYQILFESCENSLYEQLISIIRYSNYYLNNKEKSFIYPKINKIINNKYDICDNLKLNLINTFLKTC